MNAFELEDFFQTLLCKGKYHWTADLLFDWFVFNQVNKSIVDLTQAKQLNPYK